MRRRDRLTNCGVVSPCGESEGRQGEGRYERGKGRTAALTGIERKKRERGRGKETEKEREIGKRSERHSV